MPSQMAWQDGQQRAGMAEIYPLAPFSSIPRKEKLHLYDSGPRALTMKPAPSIPPQRHPQHKLFKFKKFLFKLL